jgi:hypothetical protein
VLVAHCQRAEAPRRDVSCEASIGETQAAKLVEGNAANSCAMIKDHIKWSCAADWSPLCRNDPRACDEAKKLCAKYR